MDDAAAGFLESDSVLNAGSGQEVVSLDLCLDEVVTVDGVGDSDLYSKVFQIKESSREH